MFSKSKPCLTGLFMWRVSEVKKVLSFQPHWGFALFFLQRDFPGPVIWTLWPAGCFFFPPLWANLWGLTLCVLGSRDNGLLWISLLRTVVTEVRNVIHLLSLLQSLVASADSSHPMGLGCTLQNGPHSVGSILEKFVHEYFGSWRSDLNWSKPVSQTTVCVGEMTGPHTQCLAGG